jgi:hypothetical protein
VQHNKAIGDRHSPAGLPVSRLPVAGQTIDKVRLTHGALLASKDYPQPGPTGPCGKHKFRVHARSTRDRNPR